MEFGAEVFGFEAWAETALLGSPGLEGWENHLCPAGKMWWKEAEGKYGSKSSSGQCFGDLD